MNLFVLSRSNHASHQEKSSHLHANRPSDQLSCRAPRYTLVAELSVTTHLRAHFEGVHKIELATQDKKNLSVTPASQLFPSATESFSRPSRSFASQHRVLSALCFHGLTNCFSRNHFVFMNICVTPRVCPPRLLRSELRVRHQPRPGRGVALFSPTLSLSSDCGLFVSLAALFAGPTLCFQSFADSFAKNRGVGVGARSGTDRAHP